MIATVQEFRFKQVLDVVDGNRTVCNALAVDFDLDKRLQPAHAPGPISDYLNIRILFLNTFGDFVGA
jgi:hypothetical protein